MFYSHESKSPTILLHSDHQLTRVSVLTNRQYGIATVWLVATLGSKSSSRRISKKAILQVNIPKACDAVIGTQIPMALRLESNLFIGILRVNDSQWGYLLSDAETMQVDMRAMLKAMRNSQLDPNAGKIRPEQLNLPDDPGFLPDMIPELDMDFTMLDMTSSVPSQRSSQGSLQLGISPVTSQGSAGGGFDIRTPSDAGHRIEGQYERAQGQADHHSLSPDNDLGFLPDVGFEFDVDGNLIENAHGQGTTDDLRADIEMQNDVAGEPQLAPQDELIEEGAPAVDDNEAGKIVPIDTDDQQQELAPRDGQQDVNDEETQGIAREDQAEGEPTDDNQEENVVAHIRQAPVRRPIKPDEATEIRARTIKNLAEDYLPRMRRLRKEKALKRLPWLAKKFAAACVFGNGLGGLGLQGDLMQKCGPLNEFAGKSLQELVFGKKPASEHRGKKRRNEDPAPDGDGRNVRQKSNDIEAGRATAEDDDAAPMFEDDIEIGRGAGDALDDVSQQMPWNLPSSQAGGSRTGSVRPGSRAGSAAVPGSAAPPQQAPWSQHSSATKDLRRIAQTRRHPSASPLQDRGLPSASTDDNSPGFNDFDVNDSALEDFELYGPGAGVDTQTVAEREWIESALRREEQNFLDFVGAEMDRAEDTTVTFEQLVPPENNSIVVASQGFLHMLGLASRSLLELTQDNGFAAPIHIQMQAAS